MKVTVVLGTLNRCELLKKCVESIAANFEEPVLIYVVDAGSTDGTVEYLAGLRDENIVPILQGKRLGQARAFNSVFKTVETPYVCWISDDNILVNRGIDHAVRALDRYPRLGMVALKVKDVQGPFVDAPYVGGISDIGILNVNQGVIRTSVLKEVRGFSETFGTYGIDPDLTAKVLLSGFNVAYTKVISIAHYRDWSTDETSTERASIMEKQRKYKELYAKKYVEYRDDGLAWRVKRTVWGLITRLLRIRVPSMCTGHFLGLVGRDWHNIMMGRYISILDPLICYNKRIHLIQRCQRISKSTKELETLYENW